MVNEWKRTTLGEFVTLQRGHDLPDAKRVKGNVPIIGSFGLTGWHNEPKTAGAGVAIGRSGGSMGVVSYSPISFWPLNTALYVKDFHGNDKKFSYYFLKCIDFMSYNSGSAQPSLNRNHIHPLEVLAPDIAEQKAIAHILGTLDDKIKLNRQTNQTLEAMAQALFKSWFVDFDPVIDNALAAGKAIPEVLQARAAQRAAVKANGGVSTNPMSASEDSHQHFPDEFVHTEALGWVPKGWDVSSVGDEISTVGGGTPSTKNMDFWAGGTEAFCTPKDMSSLNCRVLLKTERCLTAEGVAKVSSGQLEHGTVIMSSRAPIGYIAITDIPVSVNQGIIACPPQDKYSAAYIAEWVAANMDEIVSRANGSTFLEISKKAFREIEFLVPTEAPMAAFNMQAQSIVQRAVNVAKETQTLGKLRDTLLPKLISGELRIPDAESLIQTAGV
jgi:type I restriction enzyme S subunit